jgi:hypothetical protein
MTTRRHPSNADDDDVDREVRSYVEDLRSVPPPPHVDDSQRKLILALTEEQTRLRHRAHKLERSNTSLAHQLGAQIRDSGTWAPLQQDALDLVMARSEVASGRREIKLLRWFIGLLVAAIVALFGLFVARG